MPHSKTCLSFKKQDFIKTKKNTITKLKKVFIGLFIRKITKSCFVKILMKVFGQTYGCFQRELFQTKQNINELPSFKHSLSHKDFHISPRIINIPDDMETDDEKTIWIEKNKIAKLGAPKPVLTSLKKF